MSINNNLHEGFKVAVIMSLYKDDSHLHFKQAIESILEQSGVSVSLFLAVDGPVCTNLSNYLKCIEKNRQIFIYRHNINKGLATRLNELIDEVLRFGSFDFIARMDSDDISSPDRLFKQCTFLNDNTGIDIVGSDVIEIDNDGREVFYKRMKTDHDDIVRSFIQRCPFNHPTVLFRPIVFTEHNIRYPSGIKNTQDYYLWVECLAKSIRFANINEPLLYFRVNSCFHSRRGMKKALNDVQSRIYAMKKLRIFNVRNVAHTIALFLLRMSPPKVKAFAYKVFR
ncbi:glycosyltransferase [Vibrio vulnificus]|uniref:glycosyltransferase n=1 Tax=Vibrio vulnificus TaxID=672 RepID=UPI003ED86177